MFVIFRADPVDDWIRVQYVLRAEHFFRVLVLAIGAQDFAHPRLAPLFRIPAGRRLHLEQHALFVRLLFCLNRPDDPYQYSRQKNLLHCRFSHPLSADFMRFIDLLLPSPRRAIWFIWLLGNFLTISAELPVMS